MKKFKSVEAKVKRDAQKDRNERARMIIKERLSELDAAERVAKRLRTRYNKLMKEDITEAVLAECERGCK